MRAMVAAGDIRYSDKFDRMIQARDFSSEQAIQAVMNGRVVDEEPVRNRPTKYVVHANVTREANVMDVLAVELAVTDVVIFISAYWPVDGVRRRK